VRTETSFSLSGLVISVITGGSGIGGLGRDEGITGGFVCAMDGSWCSVDGSGKALTFVDCFFFLTGRGGIGGLD
jgi:hypothetical protein